jgi:hypothetical protein
MKNSEGNPTNEPEMQPEYDFSGEKAVRGKYHQAYWAGHTVQVHQEDGTVITRYFIQEEGAVLLAPDVRPYFPDSESVNQALRGLIELIPSQQRDASQTG